MVPVTKWKIIVVGDTGVGKTSMVKRFAHEHFAATTEPTISVDQVFKDIELEGTKIRLVIWDSAGQEVFKSMVPLYFRKADGCILVYDVTNTHTFHKLSGWLSDFRAFNEKAPVILAGNKNEDSNRKSVSVSVVKSYAQQEGMEYLECSAKTGENVDRIFKLLIDKMWDLQVKSGPRDRNSVGRDFLSTQKAEIPVKWPDDQTINLTDIPPSTADKNGCCLYRYFNDT